MSDSAHRGTRLADKPRTPWGTSAVTCSSDPASTSSVHRSGLIQAVSHMRGVLDQRTELTRLHRLLQILNSLLLACVRRTLLVVQPAELLQNLGVFRVTLEDTAVCALGGFELRRCQQLLWENLWLTYLFLLLVHMTNLEPDVLFGQRPRRVKHNVLEALAQSQFVYQRAGSGTHVQALVELLLLLIYYTESEVDLVGLFEVGLHAHHLREGLFGMLKRPIAIVQYSNSVPELGFLLIVSMVALEEKNVSLPWGRTGGKAPADKQSTPAADRPSSDSSDLGMLVAPRANATRNLPRLPHTSPLALSTFMMVLRYSTAAGKASLVRKMHAMPCIAGTDHWLNLSACS
jgi:hypothetical protein